MQEILAIIYYYASRHFLKKLKREYRLNDGGVEHMIFGEQIKSIRQKENLTQEQFAMKLNVSRQAVSNWENNKNLPDIGMLILMSDVFQISLDYLVKGDNEMSNMTEKVIKDGSEMRRAKYNMVCLIIGSFFILLGIVLFLVKGLSVEYIDAQGILHENFFLIPIGFLCIFCGLVSFMTVGVSTVINKWKNRNI